MTYNLNTKITEPPAQHRIHADISLIILILMLMGMSLTILYSAAGINKMTDQAIRFGFGFVIMAFILLIPKQVIQFFTPAFYLATIGLLLSVHFFGVNVNGSQRWLDIGITQLQPSEIAKLSIPLMLAYYFHGKILPPRIQDLVASCVIIIIPVGLVFIQPDLGTAILVATSGLILLFLAGTSWVYIILGLMTAGVGIPMFWQNGMKDYQKERVLTFLDPERDPTGAGYNIIQSQIAIGSGGMEGRGFMHSVQSAEFLPERTTDFIFAVFSEEFGLVGVCVLVSIYALILLRGFWLCIKMTDNFSRLLSGALMATFFIYFFINIGMVSGLMPVVGLPLPLMSYGGTSIMTLMIAFGLIMNLYGNRTIEKTREPLRNTHSWVL